MAAPYIQSFRQISIVQDITEYEMEFKTGILFYLFLSYLRGFIFVGSSYLNAIFSTTIVALFGILPLCFLIIPNKIETLWKNAVELSVILWFIAIVIPNLLFRTIVILVGTGICYGGLRKQLTQAEFKQPPYIVVLTVFLDLMFRSPSKGTDPLAGASVTQFIIGAILVVTVLLTRTPSDNTVRIVQNDLSTIASIIGIFAIGFSYLMFFSNQGILSLVFRFPAQLSNLYYVILTGILLILLDYLFRDFTSTLKYTIPLSIVLMGIGVITYPWYASLLVFGILGYFSTLVVLVVLFRQSTRETTISPLLYSIIFTITILVILVVGLQIVTTDGMIWHYSLMGIGIISSSLGLLPRMKEGSV